MCRHRRRTAGSAQSVEVKGSWDGWGPARRLRQQPDATWCIAAYLTPGMYQVCVCCRTRVLVAVHSASAQM